MFEMFELTEEGRAVIEALVAAPIAWRSSSELASATGLGLEATADLLATLDVGGWLSAWERPDDVVVTLSAEAAWKLDVRVVESGPGATPRWAGRSQPEPPPPRASGLFRGELAARLERVVDGQPGPVAEAERAEEAAARSAAPVAPHSMVAADSLPRPSLLVGTGLSPWPGPGDGRKATCPACRSRRLGPSSYCLCCDRWGLDHLIRGESPPRPGPRRESGDRARQGERQRLSRQQKRRARLSAQAQDARRTRTGPRGPARPRRGLTIVENHLGEIA
jgi:hypothetical protein